MLPHPFFHEAVFGVNCMKQVCETPGKVPNHIVGVVANAIIGQGKGGQVGEFFFQEFQRSSVAGEEDFGTLFFQLPDDGDTAGGVP